MAKNSLPGCFLFCLGGDYLYRWRVYFHYRWFDANLIFFLSLPRLARCLLKNPFPLGPFLKIGLCHFHPLKFDLSKIDFCTFFYFPFYWIILIIFFTISSSVSFFLSNFITILFIANFFPFISFLNYYFFHDFIIQN